jgi:predicted nucleic acid-binding protein
VIILDPSVLLGVLLGRADAVGGVERELGGARNEAFHAPDLIELETLNALRRLLRARAVTRDRAEQAVVHLAAMRLIRYPHAPLRARVWSLRDSLSAYDAAYVALAEVLTTPF